MKAVKVIAKVVELFDEKGIELVVADEQGCRLSGIRSGRRGRQRSLSMTRCCGSRSGSSG
jgi:hypothetical protein